MRRVLRVMVVGLLGVIVATTRAQTPIPVMLLDGESGGPWHKWQLTTPLLKKALDETGLFKVEVVTAPAVKGTLTDFKPDFSAYKVVVMNYDAPDDRWTPELKTAFEQFVSGGGGLVSVHAADNAFPGWAAFNEMIGVGAWRGRNEKAGPLWFLKDGKLASDETAGNAGTHGRRVPFAVTVRDAAHPITKGLPAKWMHQGDELYAHLRGPGKNMTVLASAFSDPANAGSNREEGVLMVLPFGKGRVVHTTLGHDVNGMSCVGFVTLLQRSTEWAATGKVTQKVPASFPTPSTVSYRADLAALDPNFGKGLNALDSAK